MDAGERVHEPGQPVRLEPQLRRYPSDEPGRRFESERRPGERALFVLEDPEQVHLPYRSQVVPCREPVGRRGRKRKRRPLLELRAYLCGATSLKERVRVLELQLPRRVIDRVVHFAREQPVADVDPLTALADLETVERQQGPIGGGGRLGVQVQREHRRRPLRGEIDARRAVQRVVALRCGELRRIGEGREVREHDEEVAHRIALVRIAGAGKQAIVLIEFRRVVFQRHPQPLQVGIACRGRTALALVHAQGELDAGAVDLAPADAVRAADLEAESGRRCGHRRFGIVQEP